MDHRTEADVAQMKLNLDAIEKELARRGATPERIEHLTAGLRRAIEAFDDDADTPSHIDFGEPVG